MKIGNGAIVNHLVKVNSGRLMVRPWVVQLDYPDPRLLEPGHPLHSFRRPEGRSVRSAGERLVPFYSESPCHLGLYAPCVRDRTLKGDAGDSRMKAVITFSSDFTQYYKFYEVTREYDPPKQGINQKNWKTWDSGRWESNLGNRQRNLRMPSRGCSQVNTVHQTKKATNLRWSCPGGRAPSKTWNWWINWGHWLCGKLRDYWKF